MEIRAIIVLGVASMIPEIKGDDVIICADSRLIPAMEAGAPIHHLVGDMDSISEEVINKIDRSKTNIHRFPREKDMSDGEIAIRLAMEIGASSIIITGGKDGRSDHLLSTYYLPYLVGGDIDIEIFMGDDRSILLRAPKEIMLRTSSSVVSLVPVKGDCLVSTRGLKWELKNELLRFGSTRGIHNEAVLDVLTIICTKGDLLVILSDGP